MQLQLHERKKKEQKENVLRRIDQKDKEKDWGGGKEEWKKNEKNSFISYKESVADPGGPCNL